MFLAIANSISSLIKPYISKITSALAARSDYYENIKGTNNILFSFGAKLLDKASIVLTPTAYSDGSLNTVIPPYQVLQEELVTNGTFDTDTNWTKDANWSIANGKATSTGVGRMFQLIPFLETNIGITVQVTFDIVEVISGGVKIDCYGAASQVFTEVGTHTFTGKTTNNLNLYINNSGQGNLVGSIDNVSVKQIQEADFDFSRGSSATRVNEKGLIEDVQILSGELVQNGDFEQIGSEEITNGNFDTDLNGWTNYGGSLITWENGGYAAVSNNSGYWCMIRQNDVFEIDKIYEITMTAKSSLANRNFHGAIFAGQSFSEVDTFQTFTQYFKATGTSLSFGFSNVTGFGEVIMTVDNVSVKEVGQNWTFGTGWSMGDGVATCDGSGFGAMTSNSSNFNNRKLKVKFDVLNYVSGEIRVPPSYRQDGLDVRYSANGSYELVYNSINSAFALNTVNFIGSIDNVSVIEITDDTDIPRIDYTGGTGALLLEPQSTNLITYSEDFSQWGTVNGAVVTDNFTTSPDGTQNAAKVVYDGTSLGRIEISTGASGTNTQSIYLKTVSGTQAVSIGASSSDLTEVTVTSEWQRFTHTGSGSYPRVLCNDAATIYVWGAQLEQKSFATSYIPTEGSTVTRSADVANNSGNTDLFNDSEGVLYAEILKKQVNNDSFILISLNNDASNSSADSVTLGFRQGNSLYFRVKSNNSNVLLSDTITANKNQFYKVALKYKSGDCAVWIDGVEQATSTTSFTFGQTLDNLSFDFDGNGSLPFYGNVKALAVFKEALTDEELQTLTT